jgi:hypothetical protein
MKTVMIHNLLEEKLEFEDAAMKIISHRLGKKETGRNQSATNCHKV